jgi:hypothetical protein
MGLPYYHPDGTGFKCRLTFTPYSRFMAGKMFFESSTNISIAKEMQEIKFNNNHLFEFYVL